MDVRFQGPAECVVWRVRSLKMYLTITRFKKRGVAHAYGASCSCTRRRFAPSSRIFNSAMLRLSMPQLRLLTDGDGTKNIFAMTGSTTCQFPGSGRSTRGISLWSGYWILNVASACASPEGASLGFFRAGASSAAFLCAWMNLNNSLARGWDKWLPTRLRFLMLQ